ncbi:MAG: hypothetical protein ACPGVP_03195 [Thiolinea sp.]
MENTSATASTRLKHLLFSLIIFRRKHRPYASAKIAAMTDISLLAVVEVDKSERVLCRAPKCGRSVYKRIHVIKVDNDITVLGSECFKKLYGLKTADNPHYGDSKGRVLTPEERQLLIENTEKLIQHFEDETQQATPPKTPKTKPPPPTQEDIAKYWEQRDAAREAWLLDREMARQTHKIDQQLLRWGVPQPQPVINEWANWGEADWDTWAQQRMAGKASWIDTPEAAAAWRKLISTPK